MTGGRAGAGAGAAKWRTTGAPHATQNDAFGLISAPQR
jgi:hypothetical protein